MVEQAAILVACKGPQGAPFNAVLKASGAPRGSLYHHFPGGKDELLLSAMEAASRRAVELIEPLRGEPADKAAEAFVAMWRAVLTRSQFRGGCAVLAVTVASDASELRDCARRIFRTWRKLLTGILSEGGIPADRAEGLATMLISGCEGAVALARAEGSLAPFELAAAEQLRAVRAAMVAPDTRSDR